MKNEIPLYIARTGSDAKERLTLQHRIFSPGTELLLEMANFKPHMRVLVVGCGCGDETIMIAKRLNAQGSVVGLDNNRDQIEEAKQAVKIADILDKVTFLDKSVYEVDANDGEFDLILCRFVIPHFEDPAKAINILKNRLCCDGKLAVQEPIISTCRSEPASQSLSYYISLMILFGEATKRDFDMAKNLQSLLEQCELKTISQKWQPRVAGEDKRMVVMSAVECMPAICKLGLYPENEVKNLIKANEDEVVNSDNVVLIQCENVLLVGEK